MGYYLYILPTNNYTQFSYSNITTQADHNGFRITFDARNDTNTTIRFVLPSVTLFNDQNKVIATSVLFYGGVGTLLAPGETGNFSVGCDKWKGMVRYELQMEGLEFAPQP